MAGILNSQMQAPEPGDTNPADDQPGMQDNPADDQGAPADAGAGGDAMDPQALQAKMHIPPGMKDAFDKIVLAGMKVMFDPKTHQMALKQLQGPGDIATKLGHGIAGLVALLFQQAQKSIPPQLLVPAGIILMARAAQFLKQAGQPLSPQDFGRAVQIMVETLAEAFKVDPAKLQSTIAGMAQRQGIGQQAMNAPDADAAQEPQEAPGAPDEQEPPNA